MPGPSRRASALPYSAIRELVPSARKAKASGKHVYHLNIGQPDIPTYPPALAVLKERKTDHIAYGPAEGPLSLREKLVTYYAQHTINVTADDIFLTLGGSEAIDIALISVCDPGDEVIVFEPTYANYLGSAVSTNVTLVGIATDPEAGYAFPSNQAIEQAITNRTKAIMICNPSNPTGYVATHDEIVQLLSLAKKHDLFVIADEVYREFCYDHHTHTSLFHFPEHTERSIMIDSLSKRFNLCGARVGAIVGKQSGLKEARLKLVQKRLSLPMPSCHIAQVALDAPQSYFDDLVAQYDQRRKHLVDLLHTIPGVYCKTPYGAFYTFVTLPVDDALHFSKRLLEEFDHNGATVMLTPGTGFYLDSTQGKNTVRIAYVLDSKALEEAVKCLREALAVYPNTDGSLGASGL